MEVAARVRLFPACCRERGLNVRVISAGTDPDAQVAPVVAKHLKANGYEVPNAQPRRATASDMAQADVISRWTNWPASRSGSAGFSFD